MARDASVIEDLEFLNDSLVGANEAAKRADFPSAHAMEKWLERHGRSDLWQAFKRRDPEGEHPSGSDRKAKRVTEISTHPLTSLLDEAESSTVAKHRRKAERIRSLIADLKADLDADREKRQEQAAARSEVERLQDALAEAKARLREAGSGKPAAPSGPAASEVRAWAVANKVACPKAGRVPKAVTEAFLDATQQASA